MGNGSFYFYLKKGKSEAIIPYQLYKDFDVLVDKGAFFGQEKLAQKGINLILTLKIIQEAL